MQLKSPKNNRAVNTEAAQGNVHEIDPAEKRHLLFSYTVLRAA